MMRILLFFTVVHFLSMNLGQGMMNFALNKSAVQSTTLYYKNFNWTADKAVDGNTRTSNPEMSRTCSATQPKSPWENHTWEVDIGFQIRVKTITVYGRTDQKDLSVNELKKLSESRDDKADDVDEFIESQKNLSTKQVTERDIHNVQRWLYDNKREDQLFGFNLYLGNNSRPWIYNQQLMWNSSQNNKYVLKPSDIVARVISLVRFHVILIICEVTIEGECLDGVFSEFCNKTCGKCFRGQPCNKTMGMCPHGCDAGWKGILCDEVSENIQQTGVDVVLVGGSVCAAIAIVVFVVVFVVLIVVKRRRIPPLPNMPNAKDLSKKKDDVVVYENPSFVDISNGMMTVTEARIGPKVSTRTTTPKQGKTVVKLNKEDDETYYNVGRALPKGTIPLSRLWDYVQEKFLDDKYFSEEFEKLPSGPQLPMTVALRSENKNKNRYNQLYPYDVNRVLLNPLSNGDSDYINASFVDGYSGPKMYIASQGTTKDNINDFWRMLWQYDVEKIVMLTGLVEGGRHKCELYWPVEEGQSSTFGSVAVRLLDTDLFADYDIRTLEMSVGNQSKLLTQFHYTAWPDKGVPKTASSIVHFWNGVNKVTTNTPIVVHCSAGIGRTGTYISLDYLANQAKADGHVNVSACVSNLRRQRVDLVQTKEQYIFLHEALVEALMLSGTETSSDNFPKVYSEMLEVDRKSGKIKLQLDYERLQNEVIGHDTVYATVKMEDKEDEEGGSKQDEFSAAKKPENRTKNRHDNILPADIHRVFLSTLVSGRNDYINAVVVPSHRQKMGFIMTQMPLTDTVIDFWRMINDFEIRTIIMLNSESSKTHDIGIYWPTDGEGEVWYGPISIRLTKQEQHTNYIERTLSFSLTGDEATRAIKQFQFTKWTEAANVPENTESFLQLLGAADKWRTEREPKPVVVHCINGAQRSGLYCVISTVIDRLKVERDVAIVQTIKRIQAIRQQIIPNYEQFRFCHECILQYMKRFETYSNF